MTADTPKGYSPDCQNVVKGQFQRVGGLCCTNLTSAGTNRTRHFGAPKSITENGVIVWYD